jgi:myosin heavy subunit
LQHQFNRYVFDLQQKEYQDEGIAWSFVEFQGNQLTLDFMEGKGKGLFAILDDECFIPQGIN